GQWHGYSARAHELGTLKFAVSLEESGFLQDLVQRSHPIRFFEEKSDRLLEVLDRLFFCTSARRNIQFGSVRHIGSTVFEDLRGESNLHSSMVNDQPWEVQLTSNSPTNSAS